jgi:hypothetical protein
MKIHTIRFLIIFLTALPFYGHAQTNRDTALIVLENLMNKYHNTDYLSFDQEYTYMEDSKPNLVLDSMRGNVQMNKGNYHLILGNTETIHNDRYNVILFKDDSLIYISKPSVGKIMANPIGILDSMLIKEKSIDISVVQKRKLEIVVLNFPDGMGYKTAEFIVDEKTGYLLHVKYRVNALQMLDPASKIAAANTSLANEWGTVQSRYYKYAKGTFDDNEFDEKKYFIKDGTEFKPTGTYKQYKIFLASPGL